MNPFMMMFSPLGGFGFFGGGCCCGVNMPYYGMDDRLTFMNFPVFRNTSMDYLLDPRLAMMQTQQSMMYGGGNMFGNTMLPLFNNFPGMNFPGMNAPWSPWWQPTRTETEEQKKEREAREAEERDPKNVEIKEKIDNYKDCFEKFKKAVDAETKGSEKFKEFEKKYNEALKEKKLADRLKKLEELFDTLDTKTLTKVALADKDINHSLFMIGYSFPKSTSYKHQIGSSEVDWNTFFLTSIEGNLSKDDATPVGILGGKLLDANCKEQILQIISTWNDTHRDDDSKGLLRKLADYIPNSKEQVVNWKAGVSGLALALIAKADSFVEENGSNSDFTKLVAQRKKVSDLLDKNITNNKNIKKSDVIALANEFDKLYAMLRIQEAIVMNAKVVDKYADKFNAIKPNAIPDDIIIKETIEDLKTENIAVPTSSELDKLPEKESAFVRDNKRSTSKWEDIDNDTEGEPEKRAQALVNSDPKMLKGVISHKGVYETTNSGKNAPKRYYMVKGDKLVEAKYNETTKKYEPIKDAEDVTSVEINTYVETINDIDIYIKAGKIKNSTNVKGVYLSVDAYPDNHREVFIIKDNKLVKINGTLYTDGTVKLKNGEKVKLEELTEDDYSVVESEDDIYTKPKAASPEIEEKTDVDEEKASLDNWDDLGISGLSDLNRKNLKNLGLVSTGVEGWYKYTGKGGGYYRYNVENNELEKLDDVKEINTDGTYKDTKGKIHLCKQVGKPEDYGKALQKALRYVTSSEEEQIALRNLNTFLVYENTSDIMEFLKGYDSERLFFNDKMCHQIATEHGIFTDKRPDNKEYRVYYIQEIAKKLLKVADEVNIKDSEYENLEALIENSENGVLQDGHCLIGMADALDRIIKLLLDEYNKTNGTTETTETTDKTQTQA